MSFNSENERAPYDNLSQQTKYIYRSGLIQIPSSGPDGSLCEFSRTHAPYGQKIVIFSAGRVGAVPIMPSPEPQDSNEVLLEAEICADVPRLNAVSQPMIQVSGYAIFGLVNPLFWKDTLAMGVAPYDSTSPALYVITPANFSKTLLSGTKRSGERVVAKVV